MITAKFIRETISGGPLTNDSLVRQLQNIINVYGRTGEMAKALGVSRDHLTDVLSGRCPVGEKIAKKIGYEIVTTYVRDVK